MRAAHDRLPRNQLLDGVQFAHFLADAGFAGANEVYPSLALDNLFENRGSLRNLSILDRVKERAEALSRKVSATDKTKLDEYLTSVREVEKRVEGMRKSKDQGRRAGKAEEPARPSPWTARRTACRKTCASTRS